MTDYYAGDTVEVVDPSHRQYRQTGTVAYLVGDNIYVRFPTARWLSTKVLFPEQLRLAPAAQPARKKHVVGETTRVKPAT